MARMDVATRDPFIVVPFPLEARRSLPQMLPCITEASRIFPGMHTALTRLIPSRFNVIQDLRARKPLENPRPQIPNVV